MINLSSLTQERSNQNSRIREKNPTKRQFVEILAVKTIIMVVLTREVREMLGNFKEGHPIWVRWPIPGFFSVFLREYTFPFLRTHPQWLHSVELAKQ